MREELVNVRPKPFALVKVIHKPGRLRLHAFQKLLQRRCRWGWGWPTWPPTTTRCAFPHCSSCCVCLLFCFLTVFSHFPLSLFSFASLSSLSLFSLSLFSLTHSLSLLALSHSLSLSVSLCLSLVLLFVLLPALVLGLVCCVQKNKTKRKQGRVCLTKTKSTNNGARLHNLHTQMADQPRSWVRLCFLR